MSLNTRSIITKKIFLDLGDVIIYTSGSDQADKNSVNPFFGIIGNKVKKELNLKLRDEYINFLISIYGKDPVSGLPLIYRPWQSGLITGYDFAKDANRKIETANISGTKKVFYQEVTKFLEPEKLIDSLQISKEATKSIQDLQNKNY